MGMPGINKDAWVVVCDGGKVLIYENVGTPLSLRLRLEEAREQAEAPTHDLGTERPGRVYASVGNSRSAVEQPDWHDELERVFLESVARRLDKAVTAGETSDLFIAAAPRALGMLRAAYTPAMREALRGEFAKDYVKTPVHELEKRLLAESS
ncbi:protein required for attachment to host cells [mine drainage metagenome]|uniref:Protein required for attachment to host cells n=1 Tax=mine drainage metagenome TaxID=410659 RepID=A0A1J5PYD4_9ZZZZ